MTTDPNQYKYAQTVNEQFDPNYDTDKSHWRYIVSANGSDNNKWADCWYSKENGRTLIPADLTAHNFDLDIPVNAYIKGVTVEISLRMGNPLIEVKAPYVIFNIYGSDRKMPDVEWRKTGWVWGGGSYAVSSDTVLSTSEKIVSYTLPEREWNNKGYPARALNDPMMGVDILFEEPSKFDGTNIRLYINWVRIKVDYDMPHTTLQWGSKMWDENDPYILQCDHQYRIPLDYKNKSKASAGHNQIVDIQLPLGVSYAYSEITDQYSDLEIIDEYSGKLKWYVDGGIGAENHLDIYVNTDTTGLKKFVATNNGIDVNGWVYVDGSDREYSNADITSGTVQKAKVSCFDFKSKVYSNDATIKYKVTVDGDGNADPSLISDTVKTTYNNPTGQGNYLVGWTLDDSTSYGVSIDWEHTDNDYITFNVPKQTDVEICWRGCFIPVASGLNHLLLYDYDANREYSYEYTCYDADEIYATFLMEDEIWYDHRVLTELTTDGLVIPFASKDTDRYMVEGDCRLAFHYQEQIDYIGCVPIKHHHYDPKSNFTNKAVKNTYKSKIYTGKTGEISEDITFHIRFPPRDWTTLQGLCELDRPVPVNANHLSFEGDILNHRGWVELNGVKNVKLTNPHWYTGELDVEYITHNINTRFQISKGLPVSNYTTDTLKELLGYVVESGDEFADYTYTNVEGNIVHNRTGYFNVESDGNYIYDENQAPNRKTLITMDNGQIIHMESVDTLSESSKISMEWYSTKILEDRENNIDRTIRLVDGDGTTVMEYKYYDYDFNSRKDRYSCRVNCSILNKSIGSFETVIDRDMFLGNDIESLNLTKDVNGNIVQETEPVDVDMMEDTSRTYYDPILDTDVELDSDPFTYNDFMYGSKIHFKLHGNVLSIIDEGFSGKEISRDNIQLEKGNYRFVVDFHNNNTDGDTNDVLHFFDFIIQESILSSDYKQLYSDMMVSSFPIPNKTLLYTRTSEEGLLYFYKNDGSAFTFMQEPFYMYWNGVDLKSREGISLFNLNNSYTIFYLQNGLVRLGFNRINGELYLYKYDVMSESYVRVALLQLKEYTDFDIGAYNDDMIEVKVGKTVFSMYRGYPYVVIKHPTDDIDILTTYNQVYCEGVNGVNTEFPVLWDLINSDNLLPHCITDDDIKASCIDATTVYNDDVNTAPTLTLTKDSPAIVKNGDTVIFSVSGTVANVDEEIDINNVFNGAFGEYTCETVADGSYPFSLDVQTDSWDIQKNDEIIVKGVVLDYDFQGVEGVIVDFYEEFEPTTLVVKSDNPVIQISEYSEITATLRDSDGSYIVGETVYFYEEYEPVISEPSFTKPVLVVGENTDIYATIKDVDGSIIPEMVGETVYFYEEFEANEIILGSTKPILETGEYSDITAKLKDVDGSGIRGERVDFEVDIDSTDWTMGIATTFNTIQTGSRSNISVTVKDENGNRIEGIYVRFYIEED